MPEQSSVAWGSLTPTFRNWLASGGNWQAPTGVGKLTAAKWEALPYTRQYEIASTYFSSGAGGLPILTTLTNWFTDLQNATGVPAMGGASGITVNPADIVQGAAQSTAQAGGPLVASAVSGAVRYGAGALGGAVVGFGKQLAGSAKSASGAYVVGLLVAGVVVFILFRPFEGD